MVPYPFETLFSSNCSFEKKKKKTLKLMSINMNLAFKQKEKARDIISRVNYTERHINLSRFVSKFGSEH